MKHWWTNGDLNGHDEFFTLDLKLPGLDFQDGMDPGDPSRCFPSRSKIIWPACAQACVFLIRTKQKNDPIPAPCQQKSIQWQFKRVPEAIFWIFSSLVTLWDQAPLCSAVAQIFVSGIWFWEGPILAPEYLFSATTRFLLRQNFHRKLIIPVLFLDQMSNWQDCKQPKTEQFHDFLETSCSHGQEPNGLRQYLRSSEAHWSPRVLTGFSFVCSRSAKDFQGSAK